MPMIRSNTRSLQTHSPGCWRWASHWECAVELVEEFSVAATDMLDALDTEHKDYGLVVERWKTTNYPGILMDAADKLIELIAKVEGDQDESLPT